jgi:hypothetical protein
MQRAQQKSASQWSQLIDEFLNGDETEQQFCDRQQVTMKTLRKWKNRLRSNPSGPSRTMASPPSFVEVKLTTPDETHPVRVVVAGGIKVECAHREHIDLAIELIRALNNGR